MEQLERRSISHIFGREREGFLGTVVHDIHIVCFGNLEFLGTIAEREVGFLKAVERRSTQHFSEQWRQSMSNSSSE